MSQAPRIVIAGEREAGVPCAHCGVALELGQATAVCVDCGAVHHETCWQLRQRCGSYECCAPASVQNPAGQPVLTITHEDLAAAEPLPARSAAESRDTSNQYDPTKRRWNRVSVWALVVALLGIPLFGVVTGLVAIVVGCIALAGHRRQQRGLAVAVVAIILGLADVVGWSVGLAHYLGGSPVMVALDDFSIDPESLDDLPERIARALRANVLVQSMTGLGQRGIGSGVVLALHGGSAYIVTNRHVVDHNYNDSVTTVPAELDSLDKIAVTTIDQSQVPGKVEWLAPHGVDLAIVSAPVLGDEVREAHWDRGRTPHIGDRVFAVGNPHGLGWTRTAGDISQVRRRTQDGYRFRVLQTTAAINPGNSGGGLYDAEGRLIGINTLTGDKRVAEGLAFSIALPTLLDLVPNDFGLLDRSPEAPAE